MSQYLISIIQAVKEWDERDIKRFAGSIESQILSHRIQVVVVFSGDSPKSVMDFYVEKIGNIKFINALPQGVYSAFDIGVSNAEGEYILFSGGDDFFMPGLSKVLESIEAQKLHLPDVIAAAVCFGDKKLLKPRGSKLSMVMGNWCQQGVLYKKSIFKKYSFDLSYKIQSDHKLNIEIIGANDLFIQYSNFIVAYFSCNGVSQAQPDLKFWNDMPSIVIKNFGWAYGILCLLRRAMGYLFYGPPGKRFKSK